MDENINSSNVSSNEEGIEIKELIMRATTDVEFKTLLFEEPDKAFEGYNLTEIQKMLIRNLKEEDFEKLSPENLEELFSADAAVYTPDVGAEVEFDMAEEDDIT